jgi:hypothetical protein
LVWYTSQAESCDGRVAAHNSVEPPGLAPRNYRAQRKRPHYASIALSGAASHSTLVRQNLHLPAPHIPPYPRPPAVHAPPLPPPCVIAATARIRRCSVHLQRVHRAQQLLLDPAPSALAAAGHQGVELACGRARYRGKCMGRAWAGQAGAPAGRVQGRGRAHVCQPAWVQSSQGAAQSNKGNKHTRGHSRSLPPPFQPEDPRAWPFRPPGRLCSPVVRCRGHP